MRLVGSVALVIALMLAPARSRAQDADTDDARMLFEQGREAYAARNYAEAARAFRRAYLLSSRPALLYNIGQAELRLGHDSLALEAFEGFLRQTPADAQMRSEVEERVRVLRSMGVEPATQSEVAAAAREADPSGGGGAGGVDPVPWIIVGIGGAAVVTGAILLGVAASEASRVTNAVDGTTWRGDLELVAANAQTLWIAGWITLGVGAAAAVGGVAWALAGSSSGESAELRVAPNGIVLAGTFR